MASLPALNDQMFLCENMHSYIDHVNQTHATCLQFSKKLNELGHRALFNAEITKTNLQQIILVALLQRALKSFQATVILLERGLPEEGQVAIRTLLELTFKTVAIAKNKDAAEKFVIEDEIHRRKFINKYKLLSPDLQKPQALIDMNNLLTECKTRIEQFDAKELGVQWYAEQAGLMNFYNSAYSVLSSTAHANVRSLDKVLDLDDQGNVRSLKYGFSDEEMDENLLTAAEALIFCLHAGFSAGDIPANDVAAIEAIHVEFNVLHDQVFKTV